MEPSAPAKLNQGCKFHPPLTAKAHCKVCGAPLCNLCIKIINGRVVCEMCSAPSAPKTEIPAQPTRSFTGKLEPVRGSASTSGRNPQADRFPASPVAEASARNPAEAISSSRIEVVSGPAQSGVQQSIHRRTTISSNRVHVCKKHPNRVAEKRCDLCAALFCFECVSEVRGRQLCAECAAPGISSRALKVTPQRDARGFADRLPVAFLYPLLEDRKYLLLAGAPALWLGFSVHVLAGLAACVAIGIWLMKIVRISAVGRDGDTTHPSVDWTVRDFVKPFGFLLLATLAALAPAIIYVPLGNPDLRSYLIDQAAAVVSHSDPADATPTAPLAKPDAKSDPKRAEKNDAQLDVKHDAKTLRYRVERDTPLEALLVLALFLFPMALALVALFPSVDALSPPILLNALLRLAPYYLLLLAVLALGFGPAWYVISATDSFSTLIGLGASFLMLYFAIIAMHIFGMLYASRREAFDWVGIPVAKA